MSFTRTKSDSPDTLNKRALLALRAGDSQAAAEFLAECIGRDPYHKPAVLNSVEVFRRLHRPELARPILNHFLDRFPEDGEVKTQLRLICSSESARRKLAVLCPPGMDSFIGDLLPAFDAHCEVRTVFDGNNRAISDALSWADSIWLEWGAELAVAVTNALPLEANKRVICRLHSYEAFGPYPEQIKWERIDDLVLVATHIREYLTQRVPDLERLVRKIHIIPNGVDLNKFPFRERRPGKNLAFLGYLNYKKGPMLLLHAFAELLKADPDYRLFLGGEYQDDRYRLYFDQMIREMGLDENIKFNGWIDDVPAWLEDKQYIVCSSVLESQGMGLLEAMACGVKPVVHNFVGADTVYERRFIWTRIDDFVAMIRSDEYDSLSYRDFVAERYSLEKTNELLRHLWA